MFPTYVSRSAIAKHRSTKPTSSAAVVVRIPFLFLFSLFLGEVASTTNSACPTKIWAAGHDNYGSFGNGATESRTVTPMLVGSFDDGTLVVDAAAGYWHSVFVKDDGTTWTTGRNQFGQLGHGIADDRSTFEQVVALPDVVRVAAGYHSTFFVTGSGEVYATGRNANGELGLGDMADRYSPFQIPLLNNIVKAAAGANHALFLTSIGTVFATGRNLYGELCLGDYNPRDSPTQIDGLTDVVEITAGQVHSVFLKSDGSVWSCGNNRFCQLGIGFQLGIVGGNANQNQDEEDGGRRLDDYAGDDAVANNGEKNVEEDYVKRNVPSRVVRLPSSVVGIATSVSATMFLLRDGTVRSVGSNARGQLGASLLIFNNNEAPRCKSAPVFVSIDSVTQIYGSTSDRFYLRRMDGTIWGVGGNTYGELGVGVSHDKNVPVQISGLTEEDISYVMGGDKFSLFFKSGSCDEEPSPAPTSSPTTRVTLPSFDPSSPSSVSFNTQPTTSAVTPTKAPIDGLHSSPTISGAAFVHDLKIFLINVCGLGMLLVYI